VRFIDLDKLFAYPEALELIDQSEAACRAIFEETDAQVRRELVTSYRYIWVAFRDVFEDVYGTTCWYTESTNSGTDDDVDHFRPKGRVAEREDHGGYWWLALNWRNFRLSCHRANRRRINPDADETFGKGDYFPVIDEAWRWMTPDDDWAEAPALLDPTDPGDPPVLTFDQHGYVALSPRYEGDDVALERFEMSRRYLHLDWPSFIHDRRSVYASVRRLVLQGDDLDAAVIRGEAGAAVSMKAISRQLIDLTTDGKPYARAGAAYVRIFQDRRWLQLYVLPHVRYAC
jgi:8-oxo-dGTP pyrophosphatase MutT (NUDIX family)